MNGKTQDVIRTSAAIALLVGGAAAVAGIALSAGAGPVTEPCWPDATTSCSSVERW